MEISLNDDLEGLLRQVAALIHYGLVTPEAIQEAVQDAVIVDFGDADGA